MALSNLPTIWAAQALQVLRANLVFAGPQVVNRDHEGEIRQGGDTVHVRGLSDPTIFDVTRNTDIPVPETLTDSDTTMVIDQAKGFNFQVDDLDRLQKVGGDSLVLKSAENAGRKIAEAADAVVAAKMVAGVNGSNTYGTTGAPITIDAPEPGVAIVGGAKTVLKVLAVLKVRLDKQNVPDDNRWVVLPPFMAAAVAYDPRFITAGGTTVLANGYQGSIAGFKVFVSSVVPSPGATKYQILAGRTAAVSYADQLIETVFYEPERRFAKAAKGQHVFGAKVFDGKQLAMATVTDVSGLDA